MQLLIKKSTYGLRYTLTLNPCNIVDPINCANGGDVAKFVTEHIVWLVADFIPSMENQQTVTKQRSDKDSTELFYI